MSFIISDGVKPQPISKDELRWLIDGLEDQLDGVCNNRKLATELLGKLCKLAGVKPVQRLGSSHEST